MTSCRGWSIHRNPCGIVRLLKLRRAVLVCGALMCTGCTQTLAPRVSIPPEHRRGQADASDPTSEAPAVRYRMAYQAFWWNCLAVRADRADSRCPFVCSGTAAAVDGCRQGADDGERAVQELVRRLGKEDARDVLRSQVARPD